MDYKTTAPDKTSKEHFLKKGNFANQLNFLFSLIFSHEIFSLRSNSTVISALDLFLLSWHVECG